MSESEDPRSPATKRKIRAIVRRDGDCCWICGRILSFVIFDAHDPQFSTIDHLKPSSLGGTNDLVNLKLAHLSCNVARGNSFGEEEERQILINTEYHAKQIKKTKEAKRSQQQPKPSVTHKAPSIPVVDLACLRVKVQPSQDNLWTWCANLKHWIGYIEESKCFLWCEMVGGAPIWDGIKMNAKGGPEPGSLGLVTRWLREAEGVREK